MSGIAALTALLKVCVSFAIYFAAAFYLIKFIQAYRAGYAFGISSIALAVAALCAAVGCMVWFAV